MKGCTPIDIRTMYVCVCMWCRVGHAPRSSSVLCWGDFDSTSTKWSIPPTEFCRVEYGNLHTIFVCMRVCVCVHVCMRACVVHVYPQSE